MNNETHVYGCTATDWATGTSVVDVLAKLAKKAGKHAKGCYAYTCTVHAPIGTAYDIENYKPKGMILSDRKEWEIKDSKGSHVPY